jgi:excisionase family DNA binding protein
MSALTTQPLLSVPEAAQLLSVSVRTVYTLVERDELPHVRVGGQIRFVPSVLEQWLTGTRKPAA